jgi:hypothetical protein
VAIAKVARAVVPKSLFIIIVPRQIYLILQQ